MLTHGWRLWLLLGVVWGLAGGCSGVPPAPDHSRTYPDNAYRSSGSGYNAAASSAITRRPSWNASLRAAPRPNRP